MLDKGSTFKNDISHLTSFLTPNFNLPNIAPQKYALILDSKVIDDNCYTYQFYDTTDKTIKFAKIYSPFSHLKNGLVFKGDNDVVKNNKVFIQLVQNYTKIRCIFSQSVSEKWNITANLFRDINAKFVKTALSNGTNKWYATNPNLIWEAQIFARNRGNFRVSDFMKYMYYTRSYASEQNGKFKVIGNGIQEKFNGQLQPFVQEATYLEIKKRRWFYVPAFAGRKRVNFGETVLDKCHFSGDYPLTDHDREALENIYPNFSFNSLGKYIAARKVKDDWKKNDFIPLPSTESASSGRFDIKAYFMKFVCSNTK